MLEAKMSSKPETEPRPSNPSAFADFELPDSDNWLSELDEMRQSASTMPSTNPFNMPIDDDFSGVDDAFADPFGDPFGILSGRPAMARSVLIPSFPPFPHRPFQRSPRLPAAVTSKMISPPYSAEMARRARRLPLQHLKIKGRQDAINHSLRNPIRWRTSPTTQMPAPCLVSSLTRSGQAHFQARSAKRRSLCASYSRRSSSEMSHWSR